ncbi:MnmC family methyltransferase [Helicobacter sp. MIT 21-1697]|uniref:MnmC family methyltransferase n=1 Tax=Helicobacter sp. MIT 21-1697 TaxID=2993733 RepID=UPI00224B814E|nr:MnmC family methyltransferase [Helicobacter sp. MIT 21-1697]MCX2716773.1 MnmC family methyltransferase [Helicobacter sp. MIT 21-1697]
MRHIKSVEQKYKSWIRQSSDGSLSAYNEVYDECYHSLKDGALSESLHKHIYPSLAHLQSYGDFPSEIYVLDICFGLGYNTFALLSTLVQKGYRGKVRIYSPEQDEHIFSALRKWVYPLYMSEYIENIDEILCWFASAQAKKMTMHSGVLAQSISFEINIYKGDAIEACTLLPKHTFDIVYQDAFSPKKNPTLWSTEYFSLLTSLLRPQGIITTYSQSATIRKNALNAGLRVYNYESGVVRGGSLMSKTALSLEGLRAIES